MIAVYLVIVWLFALGGLILARPGSWVSTLCGSVVLAGALLIPAVALVAS